MEKKNSKIVFKYDWDSAFCSPLSSVTVVEGDENIAYFGTYEDEKFNLLTLKEHRDKFHKIKIDDRSMQEIKEVLSNDRLYAFKQIEIVNNIMDGYEHRFFFSDGEAKTDLFCFNISYCIGKQADYPHANYVIDTLFKLKSILVPLGVSEKCFMLDR